jgi:hypothetical protein
MEKAHLTDANGKMIKDRLWIRDTDGLLTEHCGPSFADGYDVKTNGWIVCNGWKSDAEELGA